MVTNPVLRALLVLCLAGFVWALWLPDPEGTPMKGQWLVIALTALAATFAVGLVFPTRARWALRVVAGLAAGVLFALFAYRVVLLVRHGPPRGGVLAIDSPLRTGLGLLLFGVPLLVFALSGRSVQERRAEKNSEAAGGTDAAPRPPQ
jgi:hypothetical protein